MRSGSDPLTEDPAGLDSRADEDDREQRWATFIAAILARKAECTQWSDVFGEVCNAMMWAEDDELSVWHAPFFEQACREFAETEQWPGVLSAVARAMREQAKANS